jgi:hypothetical protein
MNKDKSLKSRILKTLEFSVFFGIALLIYWFFNKEHIHVEFPDEYSYEEVQAYILAQELVKNYEGNGKCLIIHQSSQLEGAPKNKLERLISAFKIGFGTKIKNIKTKPIKVYTNTSTFEIEIIDVSTEDFNIVIEANRDCEIIISMVALPFGKNELDKINIFKPNENKVATHYPIFGIHNGYIGNLEPCFERGSIHAITMVKPNPKIDAQPMPTDKQEAFNNRYILVTLDNLNVIKKQYPGIFQRKRKVKNKQAQ